MLKHPYTDENYTAYKAEEIEKWLKQFDHRKIEIVDGYMPGDEEFTVYFYKA